MFRGEETETDGAGTSDGSVREPNNNQLNRLDDRGTVSRRTYVALLGGALASMAGWAGTGSGATESQVAGPGDTDPTTTYGYGGAAVLAERSVSVASASLATSVAESEPNDSRGEATVVGTDVKVSGSLESAEIDWFAFDLTAGATETVTLTRASDQGIVAVALYGPDGEHLDLQYVGNDVPVSLDVDSASETGTHYVEVVDVQQGSGEYSLTIGSPTDETTSTPTPTPTATSTPTPTTTSTPTPTTTSTPTPTPVDDYGVQGYGEYGYGGVDG
jgi:hypothetical protein